MSNKEPCGSLDRFIFFIPACFDIKIDAIKSRSVREFSQVCNPFSVKFSSAILRGPHDILSNLFSPAYAPTS